METVGSFLKREREAQGLSLERIASQTRINQPYLEALEADRFERFPSEIFARGFVRSYARCLRIDEDEALRIFVGTASSFYHREEEAQREVRAETERMVSRRIRRHWIGRLSMVVAVVVAVALVFSLNAWQTAQLEPWPDVPESAEPPASGGGTLVEPTPMMPELANPSSSVPTQSAPVPAAPALSIAVSPPPAKPSVQPAPATPSTALPSSVVRPVEKSESLQGSGATGSVRGPSRPAEEGPAAVVPETRSMPQSPTTPTARPVQPGQTVNPPPGLKPVTQEELILIIEATDPGWVAAKIDGNVLKEVYLESGERVTWKATEEFVVSLGNAGGVRVELNGQPVGPFGEKGDVVKGIQLN